MDRLSTDLDLEKDQRQKWECEYELLMKQCQLLHEQLRGKDQQLSDATQSYKSLELQCQAEIEHTVSHMKVVCVWEDLNNIVMIDGSTF